MSHDPLYDHAYQLDELADALRNRAETDRASELEDLSRVKKMNQAHVAEIERMQALLGPELLTDDTTTTRVEALQQRDLLAFRVAKLNEEVETLQAQVNKLQSDLVERLFDHLDTSKQPDLWDKNRIPPRGYDLFRDLQDNLILARVDQGTDTDRWVWCHAEDSYHRALEFSNGWTWMERIAFAGDLVPPSEWPSK